MHETKRGLVMERMAETATDCKSAGLDHTAAVARYGLLGRAWMTMTWMQGCVCVSGPRKIYALLTALKKWTFDLPIPRVASRRHIFEANVNGFPLVLQVHGAKPLDDRAEQASVRLG